ncbi:DUF4132 domain-containing protein [Nocardioides zeae]|uniref:DUF4132 domain-containing protein n=1 Tax=Nocardioides imazamoxiresistens TaxID=3231893 RepID=A0ABU3PS11_9ACTN|nr:DUF4132 domain-containing protein [Nocardioides zeae]MDT9591989.1 DUF4132 domain-containing protein [Nocardioides zeae]
MSVGSGGDLGIVRNRVEEAVLAEGRPLDDLTVPPPADPRKVAKAGRSWVRKPAGPTPFDGVPDPTTAAWFATQAIESEPLDGDGEPLPWAAFADPEVRATWSSGTRRIDPKEQLLRADAAAVTAASGDPAQVALTVPHRSFGWGLLPAPLDAGARLALRGAGDLLDLDAALTGELRARDVLGLRAYGLPGVTPEARERMLAVVADPTADPARRLLLSALVASPEDHHGLVVELGPAPYTWVNPTTRGDQVLLGDPHLLVAVAAALPDPDARRTLWFAVDDRLRQGGSELTTSFTRPDLALVVFGEPVLAGLVARKWIAGYVVKRATAVLQRLSGPASVPWALQLAVDSSKVTGAVRAWLVEHRAVVGAFDGSLNAARTEQLVAAVPDLVEAGQTEFAHPAAAAAARLVVTQSAEQADAGAFGADALPQWWAAALAAEEAYSDGQSVKLPRRLPDWVTATPLVLGGRPLGAGDAEAVLTAAARTVPDGPRRPLVAAVVAHMSAAERDTAGTHLLRGWITAGERTQDKPFARAGAVLGADGWVDEVMQRVREWNEGRYNRAKFGLELVTLNASSAAAAALASAESWKKGGMDWVAAVQLGALADLLGLSVEDLGTRLLATGDLDARSTRVLDYGSRSFRASLRPGGTVVLHLLDADGRPSGKPRASLPAANGSDDPLAVAAAKKALKALRATVTEVGRTQAARFEGAMVDEKPWTGADHATYLAPHPIVNPLFRALVWRAVPPDGSTVLVRMDEGGEYVGVDEETHVLPADASVTLVHPARLTAEERDAWRAHLADHELVAPFPQLDRLEVVGPRADDGSPALPVGTIHPGTLHGTLSGQGWGMAYADGGELATAYDRAFLAAGVVATLHVTGVVLYNPAVSGDQRVLRLRVARGNTVVPWADLDPIVAAEIDRAVAALHTKVVADA